jgi:pSer/pThr/pTyr-binding forkhead associated (FHA) protein
MGARVSPDGPQSTPGLPRPATARELKAVIEAQRTGEPFLLFRDAEGAQHLHVLSDDTGTVTIGRGDAVDVSLAWDPSVSSVHAEATRLGAHWLVADEGISRNGTFVNNERVNGRHRLRDGDVVRVGQTAIAYHEGVGEQAVGATVALSDGGVGPITDAQRRVVVALCRPYRERERFATPATNAEIADELFLSVEAVKTHLRELYKRFGLEDLPQNQKRTRLAERALELGLAAPPG